MKNKFKNRKKIEKNLKKSGKIKGRRLFGIIINEVGRVGSSFNKPPDLNFWRHLIFKDTFFNFMRKIKEKPPKKTK